MSHGLYFGLDSDRHGQSVCFPFHRLSRKQGGDESLPSSRRCHALCPYLWPTENRNALHLHPTLSPSQMCKQVKSPPAGWACGWVDLITLGLRRDTWLKRLIMHVLCPVCRAKQPSSTTLERTAIVVRAARRLRYNHARFREATIAETCTSTGRSTGRSFPIINALPVSTVVPDWVVEGINVACILTPNSLEAPKGAWISVWKFGRAPIAEPVPICRVALRGTELLRVPTNLAQTSVTISCRGQVLQTCTRLQQRTLHCQDRNAIAAIPCDRNLVRTSDSNQKEDDLCSLLPHPAQLK